MKNKNASGVHTKKTLQAKPLQAEKTAIIPSKTGAWRKRFITALKRRPIVKEACIAASISRGTAYAYRERSAVFRAQWANAVKEGCDELLSSAWEKATRTETTTVRTVETDSQGRTIIREVTKAPCSAALTKLLNAYIPEMFREEVHAVVSGTGTDGAVKVETDVKILPTAELRMIAAEAVAAGMARSLVPDSTQAIAVAAAVQPVNGD